MQEDWEASVRPAARGIRAAMIGLDGLLLVSGVVLIIMGTTTNRYVQTSDITIEDAQLPKLWALGLMPIAAGLLGIVCVTLQSRKWIIVWLVVAVALNIGGFVYFVFSDVLDPTVYGIHIHIFGTCQEQNGLCSCQWEARDRSSLLNGPCDQIRHTTSLYLGLMFVYVVSLAATGIISILSCVLTICLRFCASKEPNPLELHTTIYGVNMHNRSDSQSLYFNTQYYFISRGDPDAYESSGEHYSNERSYYRYSTTDQLKVTRTLHNRGVRHDAEPSSADDASIETSLDNKASSAKQEKRSGDTVGQADSVDARGLCVSAAHSLSEPNRLCATQPDRNPMSDSILTEKVGQPSQPARSESLPEVDTNMVYRARSCQKGDRIWIPNGDALTQTYEGSGPNGQLRHQSPKQVFGGDQLSKLNALVQSDISPAAESSSNGQCVNHQRS